jgi:hypothetical protein
LISTSLKFVRSLARRALTSAFSAWAAQLVIAPIAMAAEVKATIDFRYLQYIELAPGVRLGTLMCQLKYVDHRIGIRCWWDIVVIKI